MECAFWMGGDGWDFCDVDASFNLIYFFLGTQTILVLAFTFGGMGLYNFLDVLGFDILQLYAKALGPLEFLTLCVEASKFLFWNPLGLVE